MRTSHGQCIDLQKAPDKIQNNAYQFQGNPFTNRRQTNKPKYTFHLIKNKGLKNC